MSASAEPPKLEPTPPAAEAGLASSRYPTPFQQKTLWLAITAASLAVISWVFAKTLGIFGAALAYLQPVLVPLAAAGIIAYLLDPLVRRLAAKGNISRFRAMVCVFTLFHLLMLFMFVSVVVPTLGHLSNLASSSARGTMADRLESTMDQVLKPFEDYFATQAEATDKKASPSPKAERWWKAWLKEEKHSAAIFQGLRSWVGPLFSSFLGFFGYLFGFVMVPVYLYYFLKEADSIAKNWSQALPLRASTFKSELVEVLSETNGYLIAFFRGAMLVSLIDGLLVGIGLACIGLPYAPLIGLCVGLLGLLPYVGHLICWVAALVVATVHFGAAENRFTWLEPVWGYLLLVTVIFVVVMKINALVTAPKIIGDAVGLHPMTVIFSVLFWSLLFGPLLGALLAVPLSAGVKVLFRRYIWQNWTKKKEAMDAALLESAN
jgi:predicted PurR-regulated permease PerM